MTKRSDAAELETTSGVKVPAGDDGLVTLSQEKIDALEREADEQAAGNDRGIEPYVLDGFPVHVSLDYADGELELRDVRSESTQRFTIIDGVTAAHTRARLETLVNLGGTVLLDYSPTGDAAGDAGGDKS